MLSENLVEGLLGLEDLLGLDLNVGRLAGYPAVGLMDHHLRMRQNVALAFGAGAQEHGAAGVRPADTERRHVR